MIPWPGGIRIDLLKPVIPAFHTKWVREEAKQAGIDDERVEAFESLVREFYVTAT